MRVRGTRPWQPLGCGLAGPLGLGSARDSGEDGVGVAIPWRGGWSTPLTLRIPRCATPGKPWTVKAPVLMAWRTTRRSCVSSAEGGSSHIEVGVSSSEARLPWIMATWGEGHLGRPMARKPPSARGCFRCRGGDLERVGRRAARAPGPGSKARTQAPSLAWQHLRKPSAAQSALGLPCPTPHIATAGPMSPR